MKTVIFLVNYAAEIHRHALHVTLAIFFLIIHALILALLDIINYLEMQHHNQLAKFVIQNALNVLVPLTLNAQLAMMIILG